MGRALALRSDDRVTASPVWFEIDLRGSSGVRPPRARPGCRELSDAEAAIEINGELRRCAVDLDAPAYESCLLPLLGRYIAFDSAWSAVSTVTPDGPVFGRHQLVALPPSYVDAWIEVRAIDVATLRLMRRLGRAVTLARSEVASVAVFDAFLRRHGIEQLLSLVFVDLGENLCLHVSLYRADAGAPFAARDAAILERCLPNYAFGLSINRMRRAAALAAPQAGATEAEPALDQLTPKEFTVARLYAEGRTYKEIARELALSPATVRHHLRGAFARLGIRNKAELAWFFGGGPRRSGPRSSR